MKDKFLPLGLTIRMFQVGYQQQTTFAWWNYIKTNPELSLDIDFTTDPYSDDYESAILWQDAFDWFRKERDIIGEVNLLSTGDDGNHIFDCVFYLDIMDEDFEESEQSYEESRLLCITGMIEYLEGNNIKS